MRRKDNIVVATSLSSHRDEREGERKGGGKILRLAYSTPVSEEGRGGEETFAPMAII